MGWEEFNGSNTLDYLLFPVHINLLLCVFPGIYPRRNISDNCNKELNTTVDKICADIFSGLLEKKEGKNRERERETNNEDKTEDVYFSLTCDLVNKQAVYKPKAVPLHATKALGWRGGVTPIHYRPRHWMEVTG
jgi:hypothetical protein